MPSHFSSSESVTRAMLLSGSTVERPRLRAGRSSALRLAEWGAARAAWGRCPLRRHTPLLLPRWRTVARRGLRRGGQQTGTPRSGISASGGRLYKGSSDATFLRTAPSHVQLCLLNARPACPSRKDVPFTVTSYHDHLTGN